MNFCEKFVPHSEKARIGHLAQAPPISPATLPHISSLAPTLPMVMIMVMMVMKRR